MSHLQLTLWDFSCLRWKDSEDGFSLKWSQGFSAAYARYSSRLLSPPAGGQSHSSALAEHWLFCSLEASLSLWMIRGQTLALHYSAKKFALGTHIPKPYLQNLLGKLLEKSFLFFFFPSLKCWRIYKIKMLGLRTSHWEAGVRGVQKGRKPFGRVNFFPKLGLRVASGEE